MGFKIEKYNMWSIFLLGIYFSYLNRGFFFDDALIYARYINNLLDGKGLVYNAGEYFNGLTSPLFTYISIAISYITKDVIFSINFLSGFFLLLSLFFIGKNFTFSNKSNGWTVFWGLLLIVSSPYTYSIFGMETLLFIFLINLCIYFFLNEKYYILFTALLCLVLTRNEGVFLVVALMIEHFRLRRKFPDVRYFILPIFILVAHLIFNYSYYGAFLPETGSAKIYQGMSGLWGIEKPIFITKSDYLIDWVFGGNLIVFYTLLFMAFLGVYGIGISSLNVIVIIMLLLLLLFYSSLNIPNYHWYNAPFLFFMFMYAAEGLNVVRDLFNKVICNKKVCIILIMLIAICPIYNNFNNLRFGKSNHPYVEIGKWIKNNTSKDASIAMVEIGMVGYFSDRRIIDILGLVNPYNAKFIGEKKFGKWLSKYSPEYILAHEPYWGHEVGIIGAVKAGKYLEWTKFDFKGYKLFVRNDIDISKAELINPYKDITIYEGIFFQNRYLDPLNFSVRDYVSKKYNEKVLFSHVGTQFKVSGDVLRMMVSGNHIDFGIGILDDAYQNEHYSQGACFEIYENEVNEINLKFSQCIDPANSYTDRGILENKLDIKNMESEYIFKVIQRPGKSSAWGWSFWVFGAK